MKILLFLFLPINLFSIDVYQNNIFINNNFLIMNLPYEIDDTIVSLFDIDTPLAINIIAIYADGNALSYIIDTSVPERRYYYNLQRRNPNTNNYYISMFWRFIGESSLIWNDGRGIIFEEILPNLFLQRTNSYEIPQNTNVLTIIYKITLPYDSLTINNLVDINYSNKLYTKKYIIEFDLYSFFNEN